MHKAKQRPKAIGYGWYTKSDSTCCAAGFGAEAGLFLEIRPLKCSTRLRSWAAIYCHDWNAEFTPENCGSIDTGIGMVPIDSALDDGLCFV